MSGTVWTKFYWSDWESDPALRLCSLAAQGLWMRMLCIAAAHDPIGYVAVAGRGLDETALARMTGCSGSEASALLGELERNGVFSRDRHGRIYSRRMVADAKKSAIARKNGRNGGNPSLREQRENSSSDKGMDKPHLKPQEPEARSQNRSSLRSDSANAAPDQIEADFGAFWAAYPRREGENPKRPASLAYRRARKEAGADVLLAGAQRYASRTAGLDRRFIAQATTWLNQRRWQDDDVVPSGTAGPPKQAEPAEWAAMRIHDPPGWPGTLPPRDFVAQSYRRGHWNTPWGPEPQMGGCRLPIEIRRALIVERFGPEVAARSYAHLFDTTNAA